MDIDLVLGAGGLDRRQYVAGHDAIEDEGREPHGVKTTLPDGGQRRIGSGGMGMTIGRLVHIVRDFQVSLAFYRDRVGLDLAEEPGDNWATFNTGQGLLSIAGPFPGMPYDPDSLGKTPDQLMFLVDDVERASAELRSRGVEVGPPHSPGGGVVLAEFRDPDGRYLALEERQA